MFSQNFYPYLVTSMISGILTLLGSVGIFISIIMQRKVERLQAILEEFIDLSYQGDVNLSGKMYNLIQKYQMHYILPEKPRRIILLYVNATLGLALGLWGLLYFLIYKGPLQIKSIFYLLPIIALFLIMGWFRKLLYDLISIDETPLLGSIIPNPKKLHSISYLSNFINLSVKAMLKQARLSLIIKKFNNKNDKCSWMVTLKEELSFDDYFYILVLKDKESPLFLSFGQILFDFPCDKITGKPCPIKKNINVPLGDYISNNLPEEIDASLLIFTQGEKNPFTYTFSLKLVGNYYAPTKDLDISIENQIIYSIENNNIKILKNESTLPLIDEVSDFFKLDNQRYYINLTENNFSTQDIKINKHKVYVN